MPGKRPLTDAEAPREVEIHESETVYQGYFRVDRYRLRHMKHDGSWTPELTRELFERGHVVAVVPYDPRRDKVVLLRQFRIGALVGGRIPWQTEIVAGVIEEDEAPEDVARRETIEEAGRELEDLIPICHYLPSAGGSMETVRLYCGIVDSDGAGGIHGLDSEAEDIEASALPFSRAWTMVEDGRIDNAPAIIALQWLALHRERLRRRYADE